MNIEYAFALIRSEAMNFESHQPKPKPKPKPKIKETQSCVLCVFVVRFDC